MQWKHLRVLTIAIGLLFLSGTPAVAHDLTGATISAGCFSYSITVTGSGFTASDFPAYVSYTISGFPSGVVGPTSIPIPPGGSFNITQSLPAGPFSTNFSLTGSATLYDTSGQQETISFSTGTITCGPTTGKSFSIGPSSMEGDLSDIKPGDWVSGGYNFKFTSASHGATAYSVTAMVTVPVYCPDGGGPGGNIIIPLGAPGVLNGGGLTTYTYNIAAGDTSNHASGDQNSILVWEGAVRAPDLCGGGRMRNQIGATFNTTVLQTPHVGLVDWQFHYRDPAAKGKPNTNCTDASDPNRARADVCGASWSQTFRDP